MANITIQYFSEALGRKVTYRAIVPDKSQKTFRTLYLLHGYGGDQNDWLDYSQIQQLAEKADLAVIMPAGENGFYLNHLNGPQYSRFIGEELVQKTRHLFPLSSKRTDTMLAGLSMGGYGALRNGLYYAETFGVLGSFSGVVLSRSKEVNETHPEVITPVLQELIKSKNWQDLPEEWDLFALIKGAVKQKCLPQIFIACGTEDYLYNENLCLHRYLVANDWKHTYQESTGEHDWIFWNRAIQAFLNWQKSELQE